MPGQSVRFFDAERDQHILNSINQFDRNQTASSGLNTPLNDDIDIDREVAMAGGTATLAMANSFVDAAMPKGFAGRYSYLLAYANRNGTGSINPGPVGQKEEEENNEKKELFEALVETVQDTHEQQNEILSQSKLDKMEWETSPTEMLTFGTQVGRAIDWYNAAKRTRENLDHLSRENHWTDEQKNRQEQALSQYQEALKSGDKKAQQQAWDKMRPETQQAITKENDQLSRNYQSGGRNVDIVKTDDSLTVSSRTAISSYAREQQSQISTRFNGTAGINPVSAPDQKLASLDKIAPSTPAVQTGLSI